MSNQYAQSISNSFNSGINPVEYPDTDISNQLKTVAKLISGDLETKVYMVRITGFDTHNSQVAGNGDITGKHYKLLTQLSEAVNAFFNDLKQQNLSEDIVGLTFSEFGRKAAENGNFGTDHGEIAPMFVFGEGVSGGVSGTNPDLNEASSNNNFQIKTVQYDYRQTFGTLLQDFLGASDTIIDEAFFNHTLNESFTTLKVTELIKESFIISESCRNGIAIEEETPIDEQVWQVYPNPFKDTINISNTEDFKNIVYQIYTTSGVLIADKIESIENNKLSIYLGNLSQGVCMLKIKYGDKLEKHKIIKI